ncbi:hypothetical protein EDB19DRAFT_1692283 [Suillus lakei]|nr:hypothetical protein EDB19DRAFT_1692283 [Suillus lakei]
MGPAHTHRSKYSFSEETLTGQLSCLHCSKKFKMQGFKNHEASCKKCKDTTVEQAVFAIQYEQDQRKAWWQAYIDITPPSTGPLQSVAGIQNAPPAIRDHGPLADNLDAGNFEAYDGNYDRNFEGANSPVQGVPEQVWVEWQTSLADIWSRDCERETGVETTIGTASR